MDSLTTQGKQCKLYKNNRFRFVYAMSKSGDSCYRCTLRSCKEKININACGMIREGPAPHEHTDTVSDIKFEIHPDFI